MLDSNTRGLSSEDKSDWLWLMSDDGAAWLDRVAPDLANQNLVRIVDGLRKDLSPGRARLIVEQLRLSQRAHRKFSNPERWLWTAQLLEQASDEHVSRLVASHYPADRHIVDLCCGAGCDSVALQARNPSVTSVDRDWLAYKLTEHHRRIFCPPVGALLDNAVRQSDAADWPTEPNDWLHVDPDRRPDQQRTTQSEHFSPNLKTLDALIRRSGGGSIKVAPATVLPDDLRREHSIGQQFISWDGTVRQQRWWWNVDAFSADTVTASMMDSQNVWHHFQTSRYDLSADAFTTESAQAFVTEEIGSWIGDCDPVIRAAGMTIAMAQYCRAKIIGSPIGYLTAEQTYRTPFVQWFALEEVLPMDVKKLRSHLHAERIGTLEIKTRGVAIIPDTLRHQLKLRGDLAATLLITRCGPRTLALLAHRSQPAPTGDTPHL